MGEIKSTLDLIMERTKHLTLSDEEKKAFREAELKKLISGLIQQFLDGKLTPNDIPEAFSSLGEDTETQRRLIKEEILARLHPLEDNEPLYQLMEIVLGEDPAFFRCRCQSYREELAQLRMKREKEILADLAAQGISGSACVPNLNRDEKWKTLIEEVVQKFRGLR